MPVTMLQPHPPVPSPESSRLQVQEFIKNFFISEQCPLQEAEAAGEKMTCTGRGLYQLEGDDLFSLYGPTGRMLFNYLQSSKYGPKGTIWEYLIVVRTTMGAITAVLSIEIAFKHEPFGKAVAFILCLVITGVLTIMYRICQLPAIVRSGWVWERAKVRNPAATGLFYL